MKRGLLYVATGEGFAEEAELSAATAKAVMEDINVAIVGDREYKSDVFDTTIELSSPSFSFKDKIVGLQKSPFENTIFLDVDTYICDDLSGVFTLLDRFDVAATHNQNRDLFTGKPNGVPSSFPEYSSGVLAYDLNAADDLFDKWLRYYDESDKGDQPAFRKALFESDVQITTLSREYNYSPRYPAHIVKNVKILHGRLIDIESPGADKYVNIEAIANEIGETEGHRLFAKRGYEVSIDPPLHYRFKESLEDRGIVKTLQDGLSLFNPFRGTAK
jgi:hypothetical protein